MPSIEGLTPILKCQHISSKDRCDNPFLVNPIVQQHESVRKLISCNALRNALPSAPTNTATLLEFLPDNKIERCTLGLTFFSVLILGLHFA